MQPDPVPGDVLRVRGHVWQVLSVRPYERGIALHLERLEVAGPPRRLTLLTPFDRPERVGVERRLAIVSRRQWTRRLARLLARSRPADRLLAPAVSRIQVLPYQLEPAIAMALDGVPRLLVADAVGLGKTIQAGIAMLELRLRRLADRILVLTPAGLRYQWAREIRRRFHLDCSVVDAPALAALRTLHPATVNPWSVPRIAIASFDFVKRVDVEPGVADVAWDLVVIDEAHLAAGGTARGATAHRLASNAAHVLLLSATPHRGDDEAYAAVCALGSVDPPRRVRPRQEPAAPLVVFRRTRADVGLAANRHVHLHRVAPSREEARMHASLVAFARAAWTEGAIGDRAASLLAVSVLLKRALSSPASLGRSLEHRLAILEGRPTQPDHVQMELFDREDGSPEDAFDPGTVAAPALLSPAREVEWLQRIAEEARLAASSPSKFAALVRLLDRIAEPAIVFTEFRDTLAELAGRLERVGPCAALHGGLDEHARELAIARFTRGRVRVLLATDAAGEGLNLQSRCRLVVNLELPWNPMRLEQRIGRVDRFGQRQRVHAIHLVARDTVESQVLARLACRMERVRRAMGDVDSPLGASGDAAIADAFIRGDGSDHLWSTPPRQQTRRPTAAVMVSPAVSARAIGEGQASEEARRLVAPRSRVATLRGLGRDAGTTCGITWAHGPRLLRSPVGRLVGGPGLLLLFEAWIVDPWGRFAESWLIPIWAPCVVGKQRTRRGTSALVQARLATLRPQAEDMAQREADDRASRLQAALDPGFRRRHDRLAAMAWSRALASRQALQPGLFDRRALRESARRARADAARWSSPGHVRGFRPAGPPRLVLVFGALTLQERPCWRA